VTPSSRILIGTIVAFVIVAAGLAAGFQIKKQNDRPVPVTRETLKADIAPNHNTYEVSPPNRGLLLDTYPVEITPEGPVALVKVPAKEAADVKTGQKVFLYRADGLLLDSLGEVIGIDQGSGKDADFITVRIDIEDNPDVAPEKVAKGKIIVNREQDASRLPYSALLRNEKGETYIWEAEENQDGTYTAYYKRVNVTGGNDVVFTIVPSMMTSNLFILNPDGNLRDGQKINVNKFLYQAPSQYEDQRIAMISEQRKRHLQMNASAENAAYNSAQQAPSAGCPQPPDTTQAFIKKIQSMAEQPGGAPAQTGCAQNVSCYNAPVPSP
jgi:hypothetical protein